MTCENCGSELKPATVFQYVDGTLKMQPGYECRHCQAMYDAKGVRLVDPPEENDMDEPQSFDPGDRFNGPHHDPEGRNLS